MLQIDTAVVGVVVTVLIALIGLAAWVGGLAQKVKGVRADNIEEKEERKEVIAQIRAEFKSYQIDNKGDHGKIFDKLDKIISNGNKG